MKLQYVRVFAIALLPIAAVLALYWASTAFGNSNLPQVVIPNDPTVVVNEVYENSVLQTVEYIYDDSTGSIRYGRQDASGLVLEDREATQLEIDIYQENLNRLAIESALGSLTSNPDIGQNFQTWVDNKSALLQACEDDMITGMGFNFASLGANGQNMTISRMQECIREGNRDLRITITKLYELLVAQGIISNE